MAPQTSGAVGKSKPGLNDRSELGTTKNSLNGTATLNQFRHRRGQSLMAERLRSAAVSPESMSKTGQP